MSKGQRNTKVFIDDILESIRRIEKYSSGKSYEQFFKDELLIDAIVRNFEIIGEAANHIPK